MRLDDNCSRKIFGLLIWAMSKLKIGEALPYLKYVSRPRSSKQLSHNRDKVVMKKTDNIIKDENKMPIILKNSLFTNIYKHKKQQDHRLVNKSTITAR